MRKRKAITWIEAVVVVAVLMIGAVILLPTGCRGRENARRSSCSSNLKQIGLAFIQYARDADEKAPPLANANGGWTRLLVPYLVASVGKGEAIFRCPSTNNGEIGTTDYFYNARLAGARNRLKLFRNNKPLAYTILGGDGADDANANSHLSQLPAAWRTDENSPAHRHLDGANYAFVDGHVKWFKPAKITLDKPDANNPTFLIGSFQP